MKLADPPSSPIYIVNLHEKLNPINSVLTDEVSVALMIISRQGLEQEPELQLSSTTGESQHAARTSRVHCRI